MLWLIITFFLLIMVYTWYFLQVNTLGRLLKAILDFVFAAERVFVAFGMIIWQLAMLYIRKKIMCLKYTKIS